MCKEWEEEDKEQKAKRLEYEALDCREDPYG
jgi:hypothetical protein